MISSSKSTGLALSPSTLRDRLKALLQTTGISHVNITSHSFRGGAATQALKLGAHQFDVMQAGRWKTVSAFQSYLAPQTLPIDESGSD